MGQVNVNPGPPSGARGNGGGAVILGMGMMTAMTLLAFVVLVLAVLWFVLRPMVFSGPATINVNVPAQQVPAQQQPAPAAPARP